MKVIHRMFSVLLIAGMLLGWTTSGSILASPSQSIKAQADPAEKFEPLVLTQLRQGKTDFFVTMTEQADLEAAARHTTKVEKGRYVFETLVATADRTQADLRAYLDKQGVKFESFYIVNAILVKAGSLELANSIAERKDVAQISANHQFQLEEPMVDPQAVNNPQGIESNISFVNAPAVWSMGYSGQGTVMAGNDTGLYYSHPALIQQYRGCIDPPACTTINHNYNWWDATGTYPNVPGDGHGHGTHTTGTMVGDDGGSNQIGMAPGARTVHCKNMSDGGGGSDTTFLTCFQWDLAPWDLSHANPNPDLAPDAINNSWGYWGGGQGQFRTAINNLQAAGIVVEVSAGNEGEGCQTLRSPGDYAEVYTTGSVDHAGGTLPGTLTDFSSRGPSTLDGDYFPDFMAPGENIRSSVPGGGYEGGWSGTSMSGPHVTALIGLIWSANPALSGQVATTYDIIQQTVVPLSGQTGSNCGGNYATGPNNDWGYGTIDAEAAVLLAISFGGAGTLQGTVTDANTLMPLEGVKVEAVRQEGGAWPDTTDVFGQYQMTVAAGTFDITATHPFYFEAVANDVIVPEDGSTVQDLELMPKPVYTVSGYVRDSVTNAPLNATVEFTDAPLPPVQTVNGFYSVEVAQGTWHMRASADLHESLEVEVVVSANLTQDFFLDPLPCILLVDDDQDGPDVRAAYTSVLDSLGYGYNVWDVETQNSPSAGDLAGYQHVMWFNGYPYSGTFTPANEDAVSAYLDEGGNFFFSSQDYLYDYGLTAFGQNYLHIASFTSDINQTTVTGQNVFTGLGSYALSYPFTNYSDIVNPDAQALLAFSGNVGNAAISYDGDFNSVFLGFPFEAIPLAGRTAVMERMVEDFFGGCTVPPASVFDPLTDQQAGLPGEEVTFGFTLMNAGGAPESYELSLTGNTWPTVFTPEFTESLEPGETALVTVTVTIPVILNGLDDTFTLSAAGSEGSFTEAFGQTHADVHPAVDVTAPEDRTGWPSKLVAYEFTVTNSGDYTDTFTLAVEGVWAATLPGGSTTGPMGAGESVSVEVLVEVPSGTEAGGEDTTSLKASSVLKPDVFSVGDVTTTATLVQILPMILK